MSAASPRTVWTIGHSSRSIGEFLDLLASEEIARLADVRRFPGSRAHPHFNPEPLAESLAGAGVAYLPFPELGGRRKARPDSRNTVWRHPNFRGYADHMETPEYRAGVERLLRAAAEGRTAVMCSEAVWWRCHRSLIADDLKARGVRVLHVLGAGQVKEHPYTSAARVVGGELRYGE